MKNLSTISRSKNKNDEKFIALFFIFSRVARLLPIIGLPFALAALWISGRVRLKEKIFWNAAKPYRIWGVVCAAIGAVLWTGVLAIVVARALMIAQGFD